MTVYVVIWEDRHIDVDAQVFATLEAADCYIQLEHNHQRYPLEPADVSQRSMDEDGCKRWYSYGTEGDQVRIVEREVES